MQATGGVLARLKQPEYTGENRCLPCSAVNTVIAAVGAVVLGLAVATVADPAIAAAVGLAGFGIALGLIYLRGYLVPGTPTLTKRYFPPWLLALFGKGPAVQQGPPVDGDLEPEEILTTVGALEECADRDDLCLTEGFRQDWETELDRVDAADEGRKRLLALLDLDDGDVEITEYEDAFEAAVDGRTVGTWESEAAMLADLAAAGVLADRIPNWASLSMANRGTLLNGLRLFIDTCPSCGGHPEFGTETVESCCSTHEVAAVACGDCGARLFESRAI